MVLMACYASSLIEVARDHDEDWYENENDGCAEEQTEGETDRHGNEELGLQGYASCPEIQHGTRR